MSEITGHCDHDAPTLQRRLPICSNKPKQLPSLQPDGPSVRQDAIRPSSKPRHTETYSSRTHARSPKNKPSSGEGGSSSPLLGPPVRDQGTQGSSDDDFYHVPPSRPKRGRSEHRRAPHSSPAKRFQAASDSESSTSTFSSSGDSDLDSESDSNSESDNGDSLLQDSSAATAQALGLSDHDYAQLRLAIVLFAHLKFRVWMASARYMVPPEQRVRQRARRRSRNTRIAATTTRRYVEAPDPSNPNFYILSPIDGYHHLACPFYRANPARHGACLFAPSHRSGRGLQSIRGVVRHLQRHHRQPEYCPLCNGVFVSATGRDAHVRARVCTPLPPVAIEGVTRAQMAALARQQKRAASSAATAPTEEDRWRRVFATVCPDADEYGCSPYLTEGLERTVSLLRDYWSTHGYRCIAEYLASSGWHVEPDSDAFAALYSHVFQDLMAKVVDESGE
ncbi:hypothetical protein B0T26DRAFT_439494 [Lasiosphaeria miniovina]|uniref:Uncharacterized protein n=1 Tax=Lasiosphaeria miniovina TaxID=1954250 RepID=A0AA39ZYG0_9PEZI|nr:uncharacterized protein B0T26DRAFT_439494 [Lasiosphaeria miniovina]KAK0705962.1 hypothetical protein B0T26DRAFT_439494 [Lasiosphaeria miniovina]